MRLHRVLPTKPEKIYRAFLDADALARWLPPNGFTGKVHELDACVGGRHRMSFTNSTTGNSHSFGDQYLELVPNERLRYTDRLDDANLPGEFRVTVNLEPMSCGTEMTIVQEDSKVTYKVEFTKPMEAQQLVDVTLAPQGCGTNATWAMRRPMPFVSEMMTVFWDLRKTIGGELEKGLADLKVLAQK